MVAAASKQELFPELNPTESPRENCKNVEEFNCDRLSNVPAEIIFAIFSFLHIDDISRVGTLSKKLRDVYLLGPYLKFGSACKRRSLYLRYDQRGRRLCEQYADKVIRLLSLRNGLAIRHLCLVWMCTVHGCGSYVNPVDDWIVAGESCLIQELDIKVRSRRGELFSLPRPAFSYRSLRVLKLNLCYGKLGKPSGVLCSLEDLTLEAMEVDNPSLSEWISVDTCPLLKRLFLVDFRWVGDDLYIVDPSNIEELTIHGPQGSYYIHIGMEKLLSLDVDSIQASAGTWSKLKISAPKLQCFRWKVKYPYVYCFAQCTTVFHSLKTAYLDIKFDPVSTLKFVDRSFILEQSIHLLDRMRSARELQLNLEILEILFFNYRLDVVLGELQHLIIAVKKLREYHLHVLASIINRSPKLETLSLICEEKANGDENSFFKRFVFLSQKVDLHVIEFFKNHEGCDDFVRHKLSNIEIELRCIPYDVRLLEKMLKLVPGLKTMTLFCSRKDQHKLSKIWMLPKKSLPHFEVKCI